MSTIDRKPLTHPASAALKAAFESVSKSAMIDLIGDFMDASAGEGQWSIHDAIEMAAPRLAIRGDREPKCWAPGILRRMSR